MRIGVDATLVRPDRLTGVERYALSLVAALAQRAPGEIVLFTRGDAPAALTSLPVEQHAAPFRHRLPIDQAWLPLAAARCRVDLLHTLAFPTPVLWRGPAALTIHDATPWLHRETVSTGMRYYYRPLYAQAVRRAAGILTVSEASRDDLVAALGVSPDRVHVTRNGIDAAFFDVQPAAASRAPYLLAVGTVEPRKNLPVLLDAFRLLRAEGRELQLVLVGRQGWTDSLPLGDLAAHVRLTGAIPDPELIELYAGASCFVLPSRYEGFGLSLGEAMAAGTPAVASDIAPLRELAGDTVRYASPDSAPSFADAIRRVLDQPGATQLLAQRARVRAQRYSWDRCAAETLEVYRALTAKGARRARSAAPHP